MNARARNAPPSHQLALVSTLPAWRVPMMESEDELAPPKLAAMPPPFPACSSTTPMRSTASIIRMISRSVYIRSVWGLLVRQYRGYGRFIQVRERHPTPSFAGGELLGGDLGGHAGAHDRDPAAGVEARAAHQDAVHVGRRQQRRCVPGVHAAAVQHGDRTRAIADDR